MRQDDKGQVTQRLTDLAPSIILYLIELCSIHISVCI